MYDQFTDGGQLGREPNLRWEGRGALPRIDSGGWQKDLQAARLPEARKCNQMAEQGYDSPKRFYGYMESAVDDKGRILIDKKNRDRLGRDFVAAMLPTGCLALYRQETWRKVESGVLDRQSDSPGWELYTRMMFKNVADDLNCDAQGRFVLPQWLRESANLKGDIVLNGAGDRLEIWNAEEYRKFETNRFDYGSERREEIDRARKMMLAETEPGGWEV
jgi:MraZ protein